MQPQSSKHGLIIEPIKYDEDYVYGGYSKLKGNVLVPDGNWTPYLPEFEHQAPGYETNACTIFGTNNAIELNHKFLFGTELNLSDRMAAVGAKIHPALGGTPKNAADYLRKNWSVFEEEWPMPDTLGEFYGTVPRELFDLARKRKEKTGYLLGYEYISNPDIPSIGTALTMGSVCFSAALMLDGNGLYYKPDGWRDGHWMTAVWRKPNGNLLALDSYPPYLKEIRADFIPEVAIRYELNKELAWSLMRLIEVLKQFLNRKV